MKAITETKNRVLSLNSVRSQKLLNICVAIGAVILGGHTLVALLMPYDSIYPILPAFAVLWLYFLVFSISAQLSMNVRIVKGDPQCRILDDWVSARKFLNFLALASLIGLGFHVWAKLFLLQIHPVDCISHYRSAWLATSRDSLPLQIRIASVLGHLLTSFSYLGLVITTFNIVRAKSLGIGGRWVRILQLIFISVGAIYSLYIGSRNSMLAFCAMALMGAMLGSVYSMASLKKMQNWRNVFVALMLPAVVSALFAAVQFSNKIYCREDDKLTQFKLLHQFNAKTVETYMVGYQKEFGLVEMADKVKAPYRMFLLEKCSICAPAMVYINHGVFNLSRVVAGEARGDSIFFQFLDAWLTRIKPSNMHVGDRSVSRVYGPGGLTLAGAAYHDFGLMGVLILGVVMGVLFGMSIRLVFGGGLGTSLGLCLFLCLFYVQLISNIFNGFGVISFPFIAFGGCAGLALWIAFKSFSLRVRNNLEVW